MKKKLFILIIFIALIILLSGLKIYSNENINYQNNNKYFYGYSNDRSNIKYEFFNFSFGKGSNYNNLKTSGMAGGIKFLIGGTFIFLGAIAICVGIPLLAVGLYYYYRPDEGHLRFEDREKIVIAGGLLTGLGSLACIGGAIPFIILGVNNYLYEKNSKEKE
jgi:hypothetical protein